MTLTLATYIAAVTGFITGWFSARIIRPSSGRILRTFAGMAGAMAAPLMLAVFVALDAIMLFGDRPSAPKALGFTLLMEGAAILAAWLAARVEGAFEMPKSIDELLDSNPTGDPRKAWIIGLGIAGVLIHFGITTILSREATMGTTLLPKDVSGLTAIAYGAGVMAVGVFIHFHFFWGMREELQPYSRTGKMAAVVLACVSLSYAFLQSMG